MLPGENRGNVKGVNGRHDHEERIERNNSTKAPPDNSLIIKPRKFLVRDYRVHPIESSLIIA